MPARRTDPLRSCVGCRQVKAQRELNRIGVADRQVVINRRRVSGRSAYLCSEEACWAAAEKRRAVDRALGVHLSPEDWARLRAGILS
jgi:predicted RNA-binding protein YlxR (DUF448 family)